jgi:hypothetical protein
MANQPAGGTPPGFLSGQGGWPGAPDPPVQGTGGSEVDDTPGSQGFDLHPQSKPTDMPHEKSSVTPTNLPDGGILS